MRRPGEAHDNTEIDSTEARWAEEARERGEDHSDAQMFRMTGVGDG